MVLKVKYFSDAIHGIFSVRSSSPNYPHLSGFDFVQNIQAPSFRRQSAGIVISV